jgi:hypothetical protein
MQRTKPHDRLVNDMIVMRKTCICELLITRRFLSEPNRDLLLEMPDLEIE